MKQSQALEILKTGANVFLTGEPGSGKTHVVNEYASYLKSRDITPSITASTGIAATHIEGMTIHSWAGIGIKETLTKEDISKIKSNKKVSARIRRAKVLIIDEVSMLSPNTLSMVDVVCRAVRDSSASFGGIQVVLAGDFFQLPPVGKNTPSYMKNEMFAENDGVFAYDSSAWEGANFVTCYLTEQYRQDDEDFLSLLSAIRKAKFGRSHLLHMEKRKIDESSAPENAPKLFSHNIDVDRVNIDTLNRIEGKREEFVMSSIGSSQVVNSLVRGCLSPEFLELKVGASVMFTKNNSLDGFVNGTLGVVEGFCEDSGYPVVKLRNGREIEVSPMDWSVEENGRIVASIKQIPLRLAWAITVHKSQGMSLDEAFMDLRKVFEFGQGYVALSRLRSLRGLFISGWSDMAFQVHPEALNKDMEFRKESSIAEEKYSSIPENELKKAQEDFVVSCGGKLRAHNVTTNEEDEKPFSKIRKTHPNAYRKWDEEEEKRLRELFSEDIPIGEIAKIMGRKRGGITSRLKKLELIEE